MTPLHRQLTPLLALLVGLAATFAAAMLVAQTEVARREARFEGMADSAVGAIESRMLAQLTLLRGAAGFYSATDNVNARAFRNYVSRLRLERLYPGLLGIGFAAYAPDRERLDAIVSAARMEGQAEFRAWPEGEREDYSAIVLLEPMNRRNAAAIGFDMLSEPTRRSAMQAARDSAVARTSGLVRLVQEIDPEKQPGFLIYVPLFRADRSGAAAPPSRDSLYGWIYSPLRAHDLFNAVFMGRDFGGMVVEIFDERLASDSLLYRSGWPEAEPQHMTLRTIEVAGRTWPIRISSLPQFDRGSPMILAATVGVAGALISLLIATVMLQQMRAAARTEREVEIRTSELREANELLTAEANAREEAEARMRQMQKIEAIGQLTGGIAHDFNNMLAVIIGNLDMAERRLDEPDRIRRAIASAKSAAAKAAELTQRLLAFGRQQALLPVPLDPNSLIDGMSDLLRRTLGETIQLETLLAQGAWQVHADPGQLESAILNLAINSRDAMPEGGRLIIETANCRLDKADAEPDEPLLPGPYVRISIHDTGHGMSEEVAARALEPFFTTKEIGKGTGLGLSQVYGFVRQSGGQLRIHSRDGEGTSVDIFLPRFDGEIMAGDRRGQDDTALPRANPGENVLVVEDEDQVRELSVEGLRELGYEVLEAWNGVEALRVLEDHPEIDLLCSDIVMPEMGGRQLAEAAKRRRPTLKILFMTGYAPAEVSDGDGLGKGNSVLRKPFTIALLAQAVRRELDR